MNETSIEQQLIQINRKLDKITNPFRIAGQQFVLGLFHALGNIIGIAILILIVYFVISSQHINLGQMFTKYLQSLIPKPTFTIQSPF